MRRITGPYALRQIGYCEATLAAEPQMGEYRRQVLTSKIAYMARFLAEHRCCRRCGRTLTDADSMARGYGPECAQRLS